MMNDYHSYIIKANLLTFISLILSSRIAASKHENKFTSNCLNPGIVDTDIGRYSHTPLLSPIWVLGELVFLLNM